MRVGIDLHVPPLHGAVGNGVVIVVGGRAARAAETAGPPAGRRPDRATRPSCGLSGALPAWEHQRRGRARVGGTHEWDRCTSLIGWVRDEPGLGDLRGLGVWVGTPGVQCVSFPWTGPTPGVQFCGRMALLVEPGGHALAGEHDGGARPAPGRAAASVSGSILSCTVVCFALSASPGTGCRGFRPGSTRRRAGRSGPGPAAVSAGLWPARTPT